MKKTASFTVTLILFVASIHAQGDAVLTKVYQLYDQEEYTEAMELVKEEIAQNGETPQMLQAKFYLLRALDRPDEALDVALKREKIAERKSPWLCMDILEVYAEKKDSANVLRWLEEAVNRGYIGYYSLATDEEYAFLLERKPFQSIIQRIKDNIGLDKQAKDFTLKLLSGKELTLSNMKGKIVLVDFWATWCRPCREEIPNLKELYDAFQDKGLEILGISLDRERGELETYIQENQLAWKFSFSGKAWDDPTARLYGVNSIPSLWLVDKEGILRHYGLRGEDLKKTVTELLAE